MATKSEKAEIINSSKSLFKEAKKDFAKTIILLLVVTFCIVVVIFTFSFANKKEKGDEQQSVYEININANNVYIDNRKQLNIN